MKSEVTIRPAEISDALGIARVHVNAWRETYKGIIPDSVLDALSYEELTAQRLDNIQKLKERRQCCLIAVSEDGEIIGFTMAGPIRGVHANYDSELYAIYLLDAAKRRGVGKAMLAQTAAWLEAQDFKSMLVWVLSQNTATKFYEKIGGKKFETRIIEIGKPLEEVSYGWDDLSELANAAGQPI